MCLQKHRAGRRCDGKAKLGIFEQRIREKKWIGYENSREADSVITLYISKTLHS